MIPVNEPLLAANTLAYVKECIDTGWISSAGRFIPRFEQEFARFCGTRHAVTTTSGTTALHLALASLGLGPGGAAIVPALTMIAVPFAVRYTGAHALAVDVDEETYNLSPARVQEFMESECRYDRSRKAFVHRRTRAAVKAILPVHLYGHPCAMDDLLSLAQNYNLLVIEDAAEAHGAVYQSKWTGKSSHAGSMGDAGCFSFYANKIITTGEGGMVVTNSDETAARARQLKDLAHDPGRRFLHTELAFNYRMTNIQAAIGLAQLEEADRFIAIKKKMAGLYKRHLGDIRGLTLPPEKEYARSVYWMYAVLVEEDFGLTRDALMARLKDRGIDTRSFFIPLNEQPAFRAEPHLAKASFPVAQKLSRQGLYLPSGLALTEDQIAEVGRAIVECQAGRA